MNKILQLGFLLFSLSCISQVNLTSDLKGCLPFNGNASDLSGSGNHGTISGATLTTDRFGNTGKAYLFNGTSDYISLASFAAMAPTNELTISMWAKSNVTTSNCLFALNLDNSADRCVGCAQYSDGMGGTMLIWDYGSIYSGGRISVPSIPADITNWHHYVYIISQSGNFKRIYLDGVLKSNTPYTLSVSNKNLPFYIGAGNSDGTGGSIRFHGKIDDVCIYNRALNTNEVSAMYNGSGACFTVGVEELASFENGILYPTVSAGAFKYSGELQKLNSIEFYSIDGKLLEQFSKDQMIENSGEIQLNNYSNGLYFVKLTKSESSSVQKIVIEK